MKIYQLDSIFFLVSIIGKSLLLKDSIISRNVLVINFIIYINRTILGFASFYLTSFLLLIFLSSEVL